MELSKETVAVYLYELAHVPAQDFEEVGRRTIREWDQPSKMPPLAFILDRVAAVRERRQMEQASRPVLERPDKPDYYPQEDPETRKEFAKRIIAEMRAKLAAGHYDMPKTKTEDYEGYAEYAEKQARKRNGGSTIPEDPAERKAWARQQAIRQGWLQE